MYEQVSDCVNENNCTSEHMHNYCVNQKVNNNEWEIPDEWETWVWTLTWTTINKYTSTSNQASVWMSKEGKVFDEWLYQWTSKWMMNE